MKASKLIIAMKDFVDDITYGEMEEIARSDNMLNLIEVEFKRISSVLNEINHLRSSYNHRRENSNGR